jgi:hypothetical protein
MEAGYRPAMKHGKQKVRLAWRNEGHGYEGKSRRNSGRSGALEDRTRNQQPVVGYWNPWKRWTKDKVVWGTPKRLMCGKRRRVQPKHKNGIRGRGLKQQLWLGGKENVNKALRQTIVLDVAKLAVGSSIRIWKMGVKTLRRSRPLPMLKERLPIAEEPEM